MAARSGTHEGAGGRAPEPAYRRIADDLRQRIESGVLVPGSRLPTELALQDSYRVSRNTIRDALKWLTYLEQVLHIVQVGYRDLILVRLPRESEVRFFRLPDDGRALVAVLLRTGFTASPEGPAPCRLTETLFPADRTQFVINEGEVPDRLAAAAEV
jgi:DNA-binding transcriptional MocR family regulator